MYKNINKQKNQHILWHHIFTIFGKFERKNNELSVVWANQLLKKSITDSLNNESTSSQT